MAEKKHPIDELFRSKLGNYEMETPEALWKNISQRRSSGSVAWYKGNLIVMSSLLLLAFCGGVYWWNSPINAQEDSQTVLVATNESATLHAEPKVPAAYTATTTNPIAHHVGLSSTPLEQESHGGGLGFITSDEPHNGFDKTNRTKRYSEKSTPENPAITGGSAASGAQNNFPSSAETAQKDLDNYVAQFTDKLSQSSGIKFNRGLDIKMPLNFKKDKQTDDAPDNASDKDKSQTSNDVTKKARQIQRYGLSIDAYSRLAYSVATMSATEMYNDHIDARKKSESYPISLGGGTRINYTRLKSGITISAGMQYTSVREKMNFDHSGSKMVITPRTYTYYNLDPITQQPVGNPITKTVNDTTFEPTGSRVNNTNRITLIDIPLTMEIPLFRNTFGSRFGLALQPGLVANIYMKKSGYVISLDGNYADAINANNNPYKLSSGLSVRMGVSATMNLSNNTGLFIQPVYTQSLNSASAAGYPVNYRLNTFSLDFGLRYALK